MLQSPASKPVKRPPIPSALVLLGPGQYVDAREVLERMLRKRAGGCDLAIHPPATSFGRRVTVEKISSAGSPGDVECARRTAVPVARVAAKLVVIVKPGAKGRSVRSKLEFEGKRMRVGQHGEVSRGHGRGPSSWCEHGF